jgi:lysyl-tRNA synthetase class 2
VRLLEPVIQAEKLRRFNAKFQPRWVPRCVAYRSAADVVPIGLAAFVAEFHTPRGARLARDVPAPREPVPAGAQRPRG